MSHVAPGSRVGVFIVSFHSPNTNRTIYVSSLRIMMEEGEEEEEEKKKKKKKKKF